MLGIICRARGVDGEMVHVVTCGGGVLVLVFLSVGVVI